MEVGSSIAKAFKRFTIPRSTSAIGSFTTSNGTASNNIEINLDDSMPPPPPPITSSSSDHAHPPISYVQNIRLIQQQDLPEPSSQSQSSTPPLRENISSVMVRSPSADEYATKKSKIDVANKKSTIPRDISFDNVNDVSLDSSTHEKPNKTNGHHRSSIKSLLTKKFHPVSVSTSVNITPKQKKSRTPFRPFSQFLKRSHSTNTDLALPNNQTSVALVDQHLQLKSSQETDLLNVTKSTTSPLGTSINSALVTISEEENPMQMKSQEKLKIISNDIDDANLNQSDSGISTSQQTTKITNSFSASSSSTTPPSGTSSNSTKYSQVNNHSQQRDESVKPLKATLSMATNPISTLSTLSNNTNYTKPSLTASVSLYNNVNHLTPLHANNVIERPAVHQTLSLRTDVENNNENQPMTKVKMRDHSAKKKKGLRELKSRISLPPEIKTTSINQSNQQNFETNNIRYKLAQRSSYYQTNSASVHAFGDALNESNMCLSRLSSQAGGQLSRNEHRRSMLDLGFGKIESYSRLEKLGEGTYATVYKGTSNMVSGFVALKEIRLEQEEGAPCTALREVSLLKGLKHNNIVCLYDIIFDQTTLTLVFEYVEKDLKQYMEDCSNILSMKNVRLFLFQLIRGLEFCHGKKILHRDLKPQNLLINERGELKLADFGLARIKSFPTKTYSHEVVTLWYRPPDVLLGSTEYSTPIDVWAVGCIFYEMACGRPLFAGTKVEEELFLIFKYLGTPTEQTLPGVTSKSEFRALKLPFYFGESLNRLAPRLDSNGIDLLQNFLRYNPLSRISAYDALRHNFFACYPPAILTLGPLQSVLDLNEVTLMKDHSSKYNPTSLMKSAVSKRSSVHL